MKKAFWFIIVGALFVVLQVASLVFDYVQAGSLKFMPLSSGNALMYNVSYLSAGIAGLVLILWGIVIHLRKD